MSHGASIAMRTRFWKAYWVTWSVIFSYLRLVVWRFFSGKATDPEKMSALHVRNAKKIESTISQLQGLFIKIGQLISIMTNFLPEEFRKPLASLQDQVPARPIEQVRQRIMTELGQQPEQLFAEFESTPVAAASLGQVHRARLKSGEQVVVKVQHMDIDAIVQLDLKTVWKILKLVRLFVPVRGLDRAYQQIRSMILKELNFRNEAESMRQIAQNMHDEEDVRIPRCFDEYSTDKVLTLSYEHGCKLTDLAAIEQLKLDRRVLARNLVRAYCKMIFVDGIYHADPHPGNLLVNAEGQLVLLDFGAVARLSPQMKAGMPRFVEAVIRRDTDKIMAALSYMGFIAKGRDQRQATERVVEYFHSRFQEEVQLESFNLKDIRIDPQRSMERILDLRREEIGIRELTETFQVPKDWVLLERTLLLLAGVCTTLDPEMNPMQTIWPYLEEFVVGKDRDLGSLVTDALRDTALGVLNLPGEIRKYLRNANAGRLEVRVVGLDAAARLMYALGHQLLYLMLVMGSTVLALWARTELDWTLMWVGIASSGVGAVLLLGSLLRARRWHR